MSEHNTQVEVESEDGKLVYWYTCTCDNVGTDRPSRHEAMLDARSHRTRQ